MPKRVFKRIFPASKYADVHTTADAADNAVELIDAAEPFEPEMRLNGNGRRSGDAPDDGERMPRQETEKFWTAANLRIGVIQSIIAGGVALALAYASNAVSQATTASEIQAVKSQMNERKVSVDQDLNDIKSDLKTRVVTKEHLELTLKPIRDTQAEELKILNEIRTVQIREFQK